MKRSLKASILISLSFVLVVLLSFGGVHAYFSAKVKSDETSISTGTLMLNLKDGATSVATLANFTNLLPGTYLVGTSSDFKNYTIDLSSTDINCFIRVKVDASLTGFNSTDIYNIEVGTGWLKHTDGYYYQLSNPSNNNSNAKEVTAKTNQTLPVRIQMKAELGGLNNSNQYMNVSGSYQITVEAIQANYLEVDNDTATYSIPVLANLWANNF